VAMLERLVRDAFFAFYLAKNFIKKYGKPEIIMDD
jgi:hypothetical protein